MKATNFRPAFFVLSLAALLHGGSIETFNSLSQIYSNYSIQTNAVSSLALTELTGAVRFDFISATGDCNLTSAPSVLFPIQPQTNSSFIFTSSIVMQSGQALHLDLIEMDGDIFRTTFTNSQTNSQIEIEPAGFSLFSAAGGGIFQPDALTQIRWVFTGAGTAQADFFDFKCLLQKPDDILIAETSAGQVNAISSLPAGTTELFWQFTSNSFFSNPQTFRSASNSADSISVIPSVPWYFRVRSENAIGESRWVSAWHTASGAGVPPAPQGFYAEDSGSNWARLSWVMPSSAQASLLSWSEINIQPGSWNLVSASNIFLSTISNLQENKTYYFWICFSNQWGLSPAVQTAVFTAESILPKIPEGFDTPKWIADHKPGSAGKELHWLEESRAVTAEPVLLNSFVSADELFRLRLITETGKEILTFNSFRSHLKGWWKIPLDISDTDFKGPCLLEIWGSSKRYYVTLVIE